MTGPHLAAACKLVFKLARNDKNDHFFINTNLLGESHKLFNNDCVEYAERGFRFSVSNKKLKKCKMHEA